MSCAHPYIFIINEMLFELPLLGMSICFIFLTDYLCLCTGISSMQPGLLLFFSVYGSVEVFMYVEI